MYPLPLDFPLYAFIACEVERISELSHVVEIALTGSPEPAWIRFEGPAVLHLPDGTERQLDNSMLTTGGNNFQVLLGSKIQHVQRLSESSCRFEFSNGCALSLLGEIGGYESYHLGVAKDFCDV